MPQSISSLPEGSAVEFLTFWGEPVVWRVIGHNLAWMPCDSTTLLTEHVIALLPYDAKETGNSYMDRKQYGNSDWLLSNLRQWLNSDKGPGLWYTKQHSYDYPPDRTHVANGYNYYDGWAGFLNESSESDKKLLLTTLRRYNGDEQDHKSSEDKIFLLTSNEVDLDYWQLGGNGFKIPYFTEEASHRAAYPTELCISHNNYHSSREFSVDKEAEWWLMTGYPASSGSTELTARESGISWENCDQGCFGVRPACNIPSSIMVSDSTNDSGNYTIVYNQSPSAPEDINLPSIISANQSFEVSWSRSNDPENDLIIYELQRNLNDSGYWLQVYLGSECQFSDSIPSGSVRVQYRVRAKDANGDTSDWTTSGTHEVGASTVLVVGDDNAEWRKFGSGGGSGAPSVTGEGFLYQGSDGLVALNEISTYGYMNKIADVSSDKKWTLTFDQLRAIPDDVVNNVVGNIETINLTVSQFLSLSTQQQVAFKKVLNITDEIRYSHIPEIKNQNPKGISSLVGTLTEKINFNDLGCRFRLIGINQDAPSESYSGNVLTFLAEAFLGSSPHRDDPSNTGGYANSQIMLSYLENLYSDMDENWKRRVIPVTKDYGIDLTTRGYIKNQNLWLPSIFEFAMQKKKIQSGSDNYELDCGVTYDYFVGDSPQNISSDKRRRSPSEDSTEYNTWWTRSTFYTYGFSIFNNLGNASGATANISYGVVPGFCC